MVLLKLNTLYQHVINHKRLRNKCNLGSYLQFANSEILIKSKIFFGIIVLNKKFRQYWFEIPPNTFSRSAKCSKIMQIRIAEALALMADEGRATEEACAIVVIEQIQKRYPQVFDDGGLLSYEAGVEEYVLIS